MKLSLLLLLGTLISGCADTYVNSPTSPSTPDNPNSPSRQNTIEFRVTGNATSAIIRYSNSVDGMTQVDSALPYITTFSTNQQNLFISLEATPTGYPFLVASPFFAVQIFVNGYLFKESVSTSFFLNTIAVSGTWRQ